ncbi:MAG TPA: diaminopimelate decarboxylase [Candidatus Eremiobacteraceae bacterium]
MVVAPVRAGASVLLGLSVTYGTPLLVIDELTLRGAMRRFSTAFAREGWTASVTYAGKALLVRAIARIASEEGLALDVCSLGEFETALRAGVPAADCIVHGCWKTAAELDAAILNGARHVVVDHRAEIDELGARAKAAGTTADVLVRVNPGIAAHTHELIRTGAPDSKFGFVLSDGQALAAVMAVLAHPNLRFAGLHCHIGSQISDLTSYETEVDELLSFARDVRRHCGAQCEVIDVGGGLGLGAGTAELTPENWSDAIFSAFERGLADGELARPHIYVEPGRALVAQAGTTLYTIGVRKRLPDGCEALIVDGGMSDNPRPALYAARYDVSIVGREHEAPDGEYTIFGRHCETDRLVARVPLPAPQAGDVLAVADTGAYTYSMASNYNRFPRPAVVLVNEGRARLIAQREPLEHVLDLDVD